MASTWCKSRDDHKDYYRYTRQNGKTEYFWLKHQQQQQEAPGTHQNAPRRDSLVPTHTLLSHQNTEATLNSNLHYNTTPGSSYPSNTNYTTSPPSSATPTYSVGNNGYPTEPQLAPDARQAYNTYQQGQYGQPQPGYYTTSSTLPAPLYTNYPNAVNPAQPPESAPAGSPTEELPELAIKGTPGEAEQLDPDYRVRNSRFFEKGKMFALLFSEALGSNAQLLDNANVSTVMYGQYVYTQIRRFVVVQERRGFCYACPIFTYGNRATTKGGVDPSQHAIIYIKGTTPRAVPGEAHLEKRPIAVLPARLDVKLAPASRINFGIHHPIQHNVKVKDLGIVCDEDMSNLIGYWRMEKDKE